jgi:hypothetical protein
MSQDQSYRRRVSERSRNRLTVNYYPSSDTEIYSDEDIPPDRMGPIDIAQGDCNQESRDLIDSTRKRTHSTSREQNYQRQVSERSRNRPPVKYYEPFFTETFSVDENAPPGCPDTTDIEQRLDILNIQARELGFTSLLDASLAEARQHNSSNNSKEHLLSFVQAGCLAELMTIFRDCLLSDPDSQKIIDLIVDTSSHLFDQVYIREFDAIRKLQVLNKPLKQWDPEYFAAFSFVNIHTAMQKCAPNLIRLINTLAAPNKQNDLSALSTREQRRVVMVLSELANLRNNKTNFLQGMIALYLFGSKVPKRAITSLNSLGYCVSYRSLGRFLRSAATDALKRLKEVAVSGKAFVTVLDNLTKKVNVRYPRISNEPEFLNLTVVFTVIPPASRSYAMFSRADFYRDRIPQLTIADFLPTPADHNNIYKSFSSMLADAVKLCAKELKVKLPKLKFAMPDIFPIDPSQAPEILPLPTYDLNEGVVNEMIEILNSIQSDVGLSETQCTKNLSLFCGDLMTIQNIGFSFH